MNPMQQRPCIDQAFLRVTYNDDNATKQADEDCDDSELCSILAASFRGEAVEWRRMPDGEVKCLGFVEAGEKEPYRCDKTADMF